MNTELFLLLWSIASAVAPNPEPTMITSKLKAMCTPPFGSGVVGEDRWDCETDQLRLTRLDPVLNDHCPRLPAPADIGAQPRSLAETIKQFRPASFHQRNIL